MRDLDMQVVAQALDWTRDGHTIWLCTVLSTYGSSPRAPGSMLVACGDGQTIGSLSGGCVEEDFIERLQDGAYEKPVTVCRYGETREESHRFALPCAGILEVLIERREPEAGWLAHLVSLNQALQGQLQLVRWVELDSGDYRLLADETDDGTRIVRYPRAVGMRVGPALKLLLAGISPVAEACARFARALGHAVIVCDPREELCRGFNVGDIEVHEVLPSRYIAAGGCHAATAVVALTHDPRIDDLAMIEAVRTDAFYIGVMGSRRTSDARATRLIRSGGLCQAEVERIHMPVGLDLGSKTPAEIALAVMADVLRVYNGRNRDAL